MKLYKKDKIVPLTGLILEIFNVFLEKPHRSDIIDLLLNLRTARPGYKVNFRVKSKFMTGSKFGILSDES